MNPQTYMYETQIRWGGARRGSLESAGLPDLAVSTPPEFKGEAGYWTPEHLFVAAAEACLMATFIGIAENSRLPIAGYRSSAFGSLERVEGEGLRFTEIAILPAVDLEKPEDQSLAERVMAKAEKTCLIAKSMKPALRVDAMFHVKHSLAAA